MILKIIAEHGTHYRDGVANIAVWDSRDSNILRAKYVGQPPFGNYVRELLEQELEPPVAGATQSEDIPEPIEVLNINDTVIAFEWPKAGEPVSSHIDLIHVSYHNTKGAPGEQEELYIDRQCTVYLMSDEGKTVERLI